MKLSEELKWRGIYYQSTLDDLNTLDSKKLKFYLGIDPSAKSLTVGNLAVIMLAKCLIKHSYEAVILIGGATGLIGDPDGKASERDLIGSAELNKNKENIKNQLEKIIGVKEVKYIDNLDWFKDINYINFLRDIGKHIPMRQMLSRQFVSDRLGEKSSGISYAEFSYVLMQAYDFLYLNKNYNVNLQIAGSDQWGNCIAGVDLIRRIENMQVDVLSMPLLINKTSGLKFGKTEEGAIWLDPALTKPTEFYQYWINLDDDSAIKFLKIFTDLSKDETDKIINDHIKNPKKRIVQIKLAIEVTKLIHGEAKLNDAKAITDLITGTKTINKLTAKQLNNLKTNIYFTKAKANESIVDILTRSGLVESKTEASRLLKDNAISLNNDKISRINLTQSDFTNNYLLIRRGKAFKDTALVELIQ